MFLLIRAREQLGICAQGLEEDDSFELPDDEMVRKRKIQQLRILGKKPAVAGKIKSKCHFLSVAVNYDDVSCCRRKGSSKAEEQKQQDEDDEHTKENDCKRRRSGKDGEVSEKKVVNETHMTISINWRSKVDQKWHLKVNGDGREEDDGEDDEGASVWYRLGPFFTNLA